MDLAQILKEALANFQQHLHDYVRGGFPSETDIGAILRQDFVPFFDAVHSQAQSRQVPQAPSSGEWRNLLPQGDLPAVPSWLTDVIAQRQSLLESLPSASADPTLAAAPASSWLSSITQPAAENPAGGGGAASPWSAR